MLDNKPTGKADSREASDETTCFVAGCLFCELPEDKFEVLDENRHCLTLRDTIAKIEQLYTMFGKDNVLPFIFFIGIQPGTPVERLLIEQGYLPSDYDPLSLNPFVIKRLLYNPAPLGPLIGRAYLEAVEQLQGKGNGEYIGRVTMDILARKLAQEDAIGSVPSVGCAWSPGNTA